MSERDLSSLLLSVLRSFLFTAQVLLQAPKLPLGTPQISRILDLFAFSIGVDDGRKMRETQVDAR